MENVVNKMVKEKCYEQVFATGDSCELVLRNVSGRVTITGWEHPQVHAVAIKRIGTYWGAQQAFEETFVDMHQRGSTVYLRTCRERTFNPFAWMGLGTTWPDVDYTVRMPFKGRVSVRVVGGLVHITDLQGSLYARAISGSISLERVSGTMILIGVSGRLTMQEVSGNLGIRTVDGRVVARQSRLDSFFGKTVSGDIALETPLLSQATYSARSVSGDWRLFLPPEARATVELVSTSGLVHCELPCQITQIKHGCWQGTVNGGDGATVVFRSASGNLTISHAGPGEPPPAREPGGASLQPPESADMIILQAVAQGEISLEEALERLERLKEQD